VTRERYVAFLQGSLVALEHIEPSLLSFFRNAVPSRCDLLRADLSALGRSSPDLSATPLHEPSEIPQIDSEAAAFGARYVIEGSALGGAVLARAFDAALQLNGASQRFLTLYGARLGEHWRGFCAELEQFGKMATPSAQTEACASARAVFNFYAAAFRSTGAITVTS